MWNKYASCEQRAGAGCSSTSCACCKIGAPCARSGRSSTSSSCCKSGARCGRADLACLLLDAQAEGGRGSHHSCGQGGQRPFCTAPTAAARTRVRCCSSVSSSHSRSVIEKICLYPPSHLPFFWMDAGQTGSSRTKADAATGSGRTRIPIHQD